MRSTTIKLRYICCLLVVTFMTTACDKNFEDINSNPNGLSKVTAASLLAPALKKSVDYNMSRSQRVTNEFMQVTVNMGDGDGKLFRYEVRASEADYLYNNLYLQLNNFKDVYRLAEADSNKTYMGISLIAQTWLFSILTDTYGDIPYSQALGGRDMDITPAFESQEDIYKGMFRSLDSANSFLNKAGDVDATSDPIFKGKAANWRKFGNSLYLRLLLRTSHKEGIDAPKKIKLMIDEEPTNYPIMEKNDDSAILRWTGVAPYISSFATWRPGDWYTPKLASFFVDNLNEWSDPRIQKWATLYNGNYEGIPSGYPIGTNPVAKSTLLTSLMSEPLLGNILNYAELQFILAEAAAKNWISTKSAKEYYENGITNAVGLWGLTLPDYYLGGELINWDNAEGIDQQMALIHQQKYYSLFFTDLQSWFEFRRTGYPELPILSGHFNNGIMPARLNYPVYLQAANPINYRNAVIKQGPDNINTLVWWQKP